MHSNSRSETQQESIVPNPAKRFFGIFTSRLPHQTLLLIVRFRVVSVSTLPGVSASVQAVLSAFKNKMGRTSWYLSLSIAAALATAGHAWMLKRQFYPAVVYFSRSSFAMLVSVQTQKKRELFVVGYCV